MTASSPFHQMESCSLPEAFTEYELYEDLGHGAQGKGVIPTVITDCQAPEEDRTKTYTNLDSHIDLHQMDTHTPMDIHPHMEGHIRHTSQLEHLHKEEELRPKDPFMISCGPSKVIKTEESDMSGWMTKHPHNWSTKEVLDWVFYVAAGVDIKYNTFQGENFNDLTGRELCSMTRVDFQHRDPEHGDMLFELLQKHLGESNFTDPTALDYSIELSYNGMDYEELFEFEDPHLGRQRLDSSHSVIIDGHEYDVDLSDKFGEMAEKIKDEGYCSSDSRRGYRERMGSTGSSNEDSRDAYYNEAVMMTESQGYPTTIDKAQPQGASKPVKVKRPPGRPRKNPDGTPKPPAPRGRRPGQTAKGNHLWEFIRDLLRDPQYNPKLVKWEDRSDGVFRFVQSEQIASMWGRKKNNPNMTYEKLSRAMRFCRSAEYFDSVPKDGRFPKKLCFKFGPKAKGWQDGC